MQLGDCLFSKKLCKLIDFSSLALLAAEATHIQRRRRCLHKVVIEMGIFNGCMHFSLIMDLELGVGGKFSVLDRIGMTSWLCNDDDALQRIDWDDMSRRSILAINDQSYELL